MSTSQITNSKIIRPKEAAAKLGVSLATLYRYDSNGELPPKIKLTSSGRAVGYRESDLDEMIESRTIRS